MTGEKNMGEERHLLAPFISAVICLKKKNNLWNYNIHTYIWAFFGQRSA